MHQSHENSSVSESKKNTPSNRTAVFTISSNNYIPIASIFIDTYRKFNAGADIFFVLSDIKIPNFPYPEGCRIVEAKDLNIPDFTQFSFRYGILEFNTAVKPFAILSLFDAGYENVVYFDPDIAIFSSIDPIIDELNRGAEICLTPHICHPTESLIEPNDLTIMRAGAYNLGFCAIRKTSETRLIMEWWARKLERQCINDQAHGIFVDQKYFDMVPSFLNEVSILRAPNFNVAHWNLHQRNLTQVGGRWFVDDLPLCFFHFSGFSPHQPTWLSKHTQRFRAGIPAALSNLINWYGGELLSRNYGSIPYATYAYANFSDGSIIPTLVREYFRQALPAWSGNPYSNLLDFLALPDPNFSTLNRSVFVNRLMAYIWSNSEILRSRYDLASAEGAREFAKWFAQHGETFGLCENILYPTVERLSRAGEPSKTLDIDPEELEINVVGYLTAVSGVGEAARSTIRSLKSRNIRTFGFDVTLNVNSKHDQSLIDVDSQTKLLSGQIQIMHVNADQLQPVDDFVDECRPEKGYKISVPFWELSRFPAEWTGAFSVIDEIWAPSRFIQRALAPVVSKPIFYMPICVEVGDLKHIGRRALGLPENKILFFFSFDHLSFVGRKNPGAVVQAFKRAFRGTDNRPECVLVMRVINCDGDVEYLDNLKADDDFILFKDTLPRGEYISLLNAMDVVVSLHRSEGFGLLVAEAMALGKPVISTNYSATAEFLNPDVGYPIHYELAAIPDGGYPYGDGHHWAEPDIAHAAWEMRRIADDPELARSKGLKAKALMKARYSRKEVGRLQVERLRKLGVRSEAGRLGANRE